MTKTTTTRRIVTVSRYGASMARVGSLNFPIFVVSVYEAKPRKKDGIWTWRLAHYVAGTDTACKSEPSNRLCNRAQEYAAQHGLPFAYGVRHGNLALEAMRPEAQVAYHLGARDLRVA